MKLSGLQIMKNVEESLITQDVIDNAYTYESYRKLIDELLEENKTTGPNQSEEMAQYTKMNVHRMKRLDKQVEVNEDLIERVKQINKPVVRSEEHTSELQSRGHLVCRLLHEKKKRGGKHSTSE